MIYCILFMKLHSKTETISSHQVATD